MSDGDINVDSIDGEVSTSANIVGELYPQGEAGTITIGTTTTGDAGTDAEVENVGTSTNAILNFTIPKGSKGDTGATGQDGYSPTVTTSKVGKTTTITITDAEGEHTATILDGQDGQGSGDMLTSVYDTDHNGIVDNAEKVNGKTVLTDVPADAVFTDHVYTAGTGIDITNGVITNTQTSAEWGNITGTLSDQTDLKNALDDKANASSLSTVATSGSYTDLSNKPSIPTKVSDLNNDSGFIDKDVNNLTNYYKKSETYTKAEVDTAIEDNEEVLIGSDSGIKAGHQLWVDTSDVTPYINSEISDDYGTAQNIGYSQNYANNNFASPDLATGSRNGLMSSADFTKLGAMAINNTYGTSTTEAYSQSYVNNLTTYSTTETRVGTWIDGKPIYRKVISFASSDNMNFSKAHNITNGDKFWLNGSASFIIGGTSTESLPVNYYNNANDFCRTWLNTSNIRVISPSSFGTNRTFYIVVEYTKTTD